MPRNPPASSQRYAVGYDATTIRMKCTASPVRMRATPLTPPTATIEPLLSGPTHTAAGNRTTHPPARSEHFAHCQRLCGINLSPSLIEPAPAKSVALHTAPAELFAHANAPARALCSCQCPRRAFAHATAPAEHFAHATAPAANGTPPPS